MVSLAVDAIVFGYGQDKTVKVLLIKRGHGAFKGKWAIPGGFIHEGEDLEDAVKRELQEETGVKLELGNLEQLYTFGKPDRDPRYRVVSVAYFTLVRPEGYQLFADTDAADAEWFALNDLPELAFDHEQILDKAIERLRAKVTYEPIGFELLPEKFPFSDLEHLYTSLLGRTIDRRNFRKKMLSLDILEELDEKVVQGPGRPASLFRFRKKRYQDLEKEGMGFGVLL